MSFTDFGFFIFVAVVFLLYFTVFKKCQSWLLLIASIIFYLFSGPKYIVYILISSMTTYFCAMRIQKLRDLQEGEMGSEDLTREQVKAIETGYGRSRKRWLLLDLLIVIGLLVGIKYTDFILFEVSELLRRFGLDWSRQFGFVLPLGISFYTFMAVGYVLDVYWEKYRAEKSYPKVLLFMCYFPHILQGPIARFDKLGPQFDGVHCFDYDRFCKGIQLALWGLFEKMVIADRLAVFTSEVFGRWQGLSGLPLFVGLVFFSMQMYLDFLGCMDIGRGISQVMGIELEKNFDHPFFSKSMPEFWRRWHITLGSWFKDYLLYPVSMSRLCKRINKVTRRKWGNKASRTLSSVIPTACVWVITGLWHGAALRYLAWGMYHGFLVIMSLLMEEPFKWVNRKLRIRTESWSFNFFRVARTFLLSTIGRAFFAANSTKNSLRLIARAFDLRHHNIHMLWNGALYKYGLDMNNFILAVILIFIVWAVSILQKKINIRDEIAKQNIVFRWVFYYGLVFAIIIFGMYGPEYDASSFIYGQF